MYRAGASIREVRELPVLSLEILLFQERWRSSSARRAHDPKDRGANPLLSIALSFIVSKRQNCT